MQEELDYFIEKLKKDHPQWSDAAIESKAREYVKVRFRKNGKNEWVSVDGVASDIDKEEFYNLMHVKGRLPMKPDLTELAIASKNRYENFKYNFELIAKAEIVEESSNPSLFNYIAEKTKLKNNKPDDFILLKSVLVTSLPFVNANGDAFKPEDLVESVESGQLDKFQPAIVDWRHNFQPMGNTIGAEIIDTSVEVDGMDSKQNVKQIIVYSVFYAWLYPYEAEKIRSWAKKKILTFSMACGADGVEWINGMNRILLKPQFVANSVIPPDGDPADRNANNLEIAKIKDNNQEEDVDMDKIKELEAKILTLSQTIESKDKELSTLKASEITKENAALKAEIDELQKTLDTTKAEVEDFKGKIDEASDAAVAASKEIEDLKSGLAEALKQVKDIRQAEVDEINEDRKTEIAGFVEDEDRVNHWAAKYEAILNEAGEIVDDAEGYEEFIALFEKAEEGIEGEVEGEVEVDTKNKEDSKMTKLSATANKTPSKKRKEADKKKISKTWVN